MIDARSTYARAWGDCVPGEVEAPNASSATVVWNILKTRTFETELVNGKMLVGGHRRVVQDASIMGYREKDRAVLAPTISAWAGAAVKANIPTVAVATRAVASRPDITISMITLLQSACSPC